ncbi:hypothetical protein V6N13_070659 [Hibiscus sabdariffa]
MEIELTLTPVAKAASRTAWLIHSLARGHFSQVPANHRFLPQVSLFNQANQHPSLLQHLGRVDFFAPETLLANSLASLEIVAYGFIVA